MRGEESETDIRVRLAPQYRGNAPSIARIPMAGPTGPMGRSTVVRLEDVALVTTNSPRNLTKFEKVLEV